MVVDLVVGAVWAMLPAYVPNNVAVVAGGGPPIDGGRTWNGRRLLGDGKTWRGTAAGVAAGTLLAAILDVVAGPLAAATGLTLPGIPLDVGFALALGAMLGDIVASFVKRRIGQVRGESLPGLDQLDFVVGALVLAALVAPGWFGAVFTPTRIVVVIVITPVLHVGTNVVAYALDLKAEPW